MKSKQTVVVVGGGFAGINFINRLDEKLFEVILIDKINHHQFQPLFYQVATSQIEPSSISFPLRHIFKNKKNVRIRLAEVYAVNTDTNTIQTSVGEFKYDILVLAMGCSSNFFGNDSINQYALTLKTTYNAISIRNHILQIFEKISADINSREALFNLVIVGAGPTGVELAGAFAEIKKNVLPKDYPRIDFSELKIILIEGSKHTLGNMSQLAKTSSKAYLQKMGVEVHTETMVSDYDGESLRLSNGETIKTKTLIWAAGVIANTLEGIPPEWITKGNRIKVNRLNQAIGSNNVYVLGDMAYMETPKYPHGHPQVANVAINQAKNLAKNIKKITLGKKPVEYEYRDLGTMATIGRNKAVVDFPFLRLKGMIAWIIWMFLHLMLILSVRNKLIIFINWTWAYVSKDTALRLILTDNKK
ncbi:MAG: NAD(P)/FAD-dependent oxidoreductase [Bacteroidales bacterium]|nr:NAD(P)/FAD-dependent oxidoreductase [Bacteroidales bacterium]